MTNIQPRTSALTAVEATSERSPKLTSDGVFGTKSGGFLGRLSARLTRPLEESDAVDLEGSVRAVGCDRVADCERGDLVVVTGRIRSVQSGGGDDCLGVTVELFDGTEALELCWLGRRSIPGIDTGRYLRVTGRVGIKGENKIMFNPRYELLECQPGKYVGE